MPPKKDVSVFLLDVGPRMHPHLEHAARAAGDYLMAKMLYKPAHEVSLVLFGSSHTRNHAAEEAAALGEGGQYSGIEEAHGLAPPDAAYLKTLHTLAPGEGKSDFVKALTVAAGLLAREERYTAEKRIVLLTNFCSRVADDIDAEFIADLAARMQARAIRLDVVDLEAQGDEPYRQDKQYNLNQLALINQEVAHSERVFRAAEELSGAFPAHEYEARAISTLALSVGTQTHIQCKWVGKTSPEKFPSPGREAGGEGEDAEDALNAGLMRTREWHYVDTGEFGEEDVPEDEVKPAHLYGAHLVPFDDEDRPQFEFPAGQKGAKVLGFVDRDQIQRHQYMASTQLLVADKARAGSMAAMAALVAAMARQGVLAVLRAVTRKSAHLFVASPVEATGTAPPHLLLNQLPFMEDCRDYMFASFAKDKWRPSKEQVEAAAGLIAAMSLGDGPLEQLAPESTPNPHIHRLYYELGRRVTDPDSILQEEDALCRHVLEAHLGAMPDAAAALEAAKAAFPMGQAAKEKRRRQVRVSTEHPLEDVDALLADDEAEAAMEGLARAIENNVFGSMGDSKFSWCSELMDRLREECASRDLAPLFNTLLENLFRRCKGDPVKSGFWEQLNRRQVKPICQEEGAPSSTFDAAAAEQWSSNTCMDRTARLQASQVQASQLQASQMPTQPWSQSQAP